MTTTTSDGDRVVMVDGSLIMESDHQLVPADSEWFRVGVGPKGRGLFAIKHIPPHMLLHTAPCLLVSATEYDQHMRHTLLEHYLFNAPGGTKLLALGYGSLLNHSSRPNVDYRVDAERHVITYRSGPCPIERDEELCISYGNNLWFDDAEKCTSVPLEDVQDDDSAPDEAGLLGRIELIDEAEETEPQEATDMVR